jgi:hypothetical protein
MLVVSGFNPRVIKKDVFHLGAGSSMDRERKAEYGSESVPVLKPSLRSFFLIKKNQKIKTWQSSSRANPDAGPLPRQPSAPYPMKNE